MIYKKQKFQISFLLILTFTFYLVYNLEPQEKNLAINTEDCIEEFYEEDFCIEPQKFDNELFTNTEINKENNKPTKKTAKTIVKAEKKITTFNTNAKAEKKIAENKTHLKDFKIEKANSLENIFKAHQKPDQVYIVNAQNPEPVICNEGTVLKFQSNSFIDKATGLPIKDQVHLHVREFYNKTDVFLANLTTTANEHILESSGMLYLDAVALNGNEVILDSNLPVDIDFNPQENGIKKGSKIFRGEVETIAPLALEQIEDTNSRTTINWFPEDEVYPEDETEYRNFVKENGGFPLKKEIEYFPDAIDGLAEFININTEYPERYIIEGKTGVVVVSILVNGEGKVVSTNQIFGDKVFGAAICKSLSNLNFWQPLYKSGKPVERTYTFPVRFVFEQPILSAKDIYTSYIGNEFLVSNSYDYFEDEQPFQASALGWINCDFFLKFEEEKKDLLVYLDDAKSADLEVVMMFHDYNTMLRARVVKNKAYFRNIPSGLNVSVVALNKTRKNLYFAKEIFNTEKNVFPKMEFSKVANKKHLTELMKDYDKLDDNNAS